MSDTPHPQTVRDLVVQTFQRLGVAQGDVRSLKDTILIQDGRYYGRSFRAGGFMAMWLIEAGLLTFYRADGVIVRMINLHGKAQQQQRTDESQSKAA